jgi:hypothetical protein
MSHIWVRAKNLNASNGMGEKKEKSDNKQGEKTEMNFCRDSAGFFHRDGMGTDTARFIIEREVGEKLVKFLMSKT